MKILIATPLFPPETGDSAQYIQELALHLKEGHEITILTYANHIETIAGVEIKTVKKNTPLFVRLFHYTRTLTQLARSADIIYTERAVAAGLPAVLAGRFTKTPVIVHYTEDEAWERFLHTDTAPIHQGAFRKLQKIPGGVWGVWHTQQYVLRHARHVLAPSQFICDDLTRTHGLQNTRVSVLNPAPRKPLSLPFTEKKQRNKVFMKASLFPWEDIPTALRAMQKVCGVHEDAQLVIAGGGKEERVALEDSIRELSLEKNVLLLGEVSRAEKLYHLQTASAFLSTAAYAETPELLYEAFQNGVPVVVPHVPGIREGIMHEKTGLLTQPANANITAEMLLEILEDESFAAELSGNAKKVFEKTFSWDKHIQILNDTFNKIHHG